jgi:thimet oligopeptidase
MRFAALVAISFSACVTPSAVTKGPAMTLKTTPQASTLLSKTATDFTATCDATLSRAKTAVAELKVLPAGQDAKVLALYDEVVSLMGNMGARAGLAKEVHPDAAFREACEVCEQQLEAYNVELSLDRALYDALAKVDTKALDPVGAFWLF